MEILTGTDPVMLAELQAVQGILAGVAVAIDEVERNLPPQQCTWKGSAYEAYSLNISQLFTQYAELVASIADARAAISSAIAAA